MLCVATATINQPRRRNSRNCARTRLQHGAKSSIMFAGPLPLATQLRTRARTRKVCASVPQLVICCRNDAFAIRYHRKFVCMLRAIVRTTCRYYDMSDGVRGACVKCRRIVGDIDVNAPSRTHQFRAGVVQVKSRMTLWSGNGRLD